MSSPVAPVAAAYVQVDEKTEGQYSVTSVDVPSALPKVPNDSNRIEISPSFGPLKITGYVDTSTLEVGVEASILGFSLGPFYASLTKGLGVNINIGIIKGGFNIGLDGKKVFVKVDIDGPFGPHVHEQTTIVTLP